MNRAALLVSLGVVVACAAPASDEASGGAAPGAKESTGPVTLRSDGGLQARTGTSASLGIELLGERGLRVSVRHLGAQGAPPHEIQQGVEYPGAFPSGGALRWEVRNAALQDSITLQEPPGDHQIRYELGLLAGVSGLREAGNTVELLDASGTPSLRMANALLIDRLGKRYELTPVVSGCAVDRNAAPPWGREVVAPGKSHCQISVALPPDASYPALYDPTWTSAGGMALPRFNFRAASLPDGRVVAIGGLANGMRREVELFDPTTNTWSMLGVSSWLADGAADFTLTPLNDGRLLMAGGSYAINGSTTASTSQLFSPVTLSFSPAASLSLARFDHAAAPLPDGRVLVSGGLNNTQSLFGVEIYNPVTDSWSAGLPLNTARFAHELRLAGGRVVAMGGFSSYNRIGSVEVYNPQTGQWSNAPNMLQDRAYFGSAVLGGDRIVVSGGVAGFSNGAILSQAVEVYDIGTNQWTTIGAADVGITPAAATLGNGGVLLVGGCRDVDGSYCDTPFAGAIYVDPTTQQLHSAAGFIARGKLTATAMQDGGVLLAGGQIDLDQTGITQRYQQLGLAEACASSFECQSGNCIDGICCDTPCDATCEACLQAKTGQPDGECAPVSDATDPDDDCSDEGASTCGQNGLCSGGQCATYGAAPCQAIACTSAAQCTSGNCVDGVCCDSPCEGSCLSCLAAHKQSGSDGTCGAIAGKTDPELECSVNGTPLCERDVCNGSGACEPLIAQCGNFACTSEGCRSDCSGNADCQTGFQCSAGQCVPAAEFCKEGYLGLGLDGQTSDCRPFLCGSDGACKTTCESVADCHAPNVCDEGACVAAPDTSGGDPGCACSLVGPGPDDRPFNGLALGLAFVAWLSKRRSRRSAA